MSERPSRAQLRALHSLHDCGHTRDAQLKMIAQGVPLPMGRSIARAVRAAILDAEPVAP